MIRRSQRDERVVVGFLVTLQMALQLDVEPIAAEQADQAVEQPADAVPPPSTARPASATSPPVVPSRSSRLSAPPVAVTSPLGAPAFIRVRRRHRLR